MEHYTHRDHATSNVLAWTATNSANVEPSVEEDAGADTDEPPDCLFPISPILKQFQRTPIRRPSEQHESLLTRALQSHSDDETNDSGFSRWSSRRRTSTASLASTADLTCGTGITTPARTSSPSPRLPNVGFISLLASAAGDAQRAKDPVVQALEKKRCISFACAANPKPDNKASMPPPPRPAQTVNAQAPPKKTSIKFACPNQPRGNDLQQRDARPRTPVPSTPKASSNLETARSSSTVRAFRSPTSRRSPSSPVATRNKKWLTANSGDLQSEGARFHEFASDERQEDDWIRRDSLSAKPKLTIEDTLKKENAIRKLGKEAEEEAELEDEELDEEVDDEALIDDEDDEDAEDETLDAEDEDDDDEGDDDDDGDDLNDDGDTEHAWDDEASDGYKTDNETGFAESDDEDDDLVLWTTRIGHLPLSGAVTMSRRLSLGENSDSSTGSKEKLDRSRKLKRSRSRPVPFRPDTPELPDSTDFVCGTLDEDRPLEEAYISCVEARKRGRLQPIPQDIDPSFPTSEPEDEAEELYRKGYGDSDDHLWIHGEIEDIHHERDRRGRKKKGKVPSPKRCRSPPPNPKGRGRSPRKFAEQRSPRLRSPAPYRMAVKTPITSPAHGSEAIAFKSFLRPGLTTQTKSLPKTPGVFRHVKARRPRAATNNGETHVRCAIDIVKGLEQKRQRRKEKFYQKYYNRARKEKAHTKRPPPGQGAERMREIGLFMAGKGGYGNYVLSI